MHMKFYLRYFDQHDLLKNVPNVFILLASVYAVMNLVGSLLLTKPAVESEQVKKVKLNSVLVGIFSLLFLIL